MTERKEEDGIREKLRVKKKISIFVPCYNEEKNVKPMAEELGRIMQDLEYEYEIILRDNGSTDATRQYMRELAAKDTRIKVLVNNRNYGTGGKGRHSMFQHCSGDAMIIIPCDFQEPPELIPEFVSAWEEGYKVVGGQKTSSKEGRLLYAIRHLYYNIINFFSDVPQYAHMSGILMLDRVVIDEMLKIDEDIMPRNAIADMGYDVKLIRYVQNKRRSGKSSFNVWRYLSVAIGGLVNTSTKPLRIMTVTGFFMSFISFVLAIFYLIMKFTIWYRFPAGIAPILIGMLFLGSVQLLFMGVLGEYIGVILRKVSKQPDVILREKINFDEETDETINQDQ